MIKKCCPRCLKETTKIVNMFTMMQVFRCDTCKTDFEEHVLVLDNFYNRLIKEHKELDLKVEKLWKFIGDAKFKELDHHQQYLLKRQHELMFNYRSILKIRIKLILNIR